METLPPKLKLKELYQALREKPLDPADPVDARWYVPYVQQLPYDPIAEICNEIGFNDTESLYYVTGQRGTGKSTELLRLRRLLKDSGVVVFYIDMLDYLHMSEPVEISDFLIAVASGMAAQAKNEHDLDVLEQNLWEKLKWFLGRVEINVSHVNAEVELPAVKFGADITARLKADDSFKQRLQKAVRGHITELVQQVQDFVIALVGGLRQKYQHPGLQVAVIIDSFEQIRGYYGNVRQVYESVVRLFGADGKHLRLPMMHTVITIPPYLNSIAIGAGEIPVSLSSVHVRQRQSGDPDPQGVAILCDMVYRRSASAREIFTPAVLQELAMASGGDIRDFFFLVSQMLIKGGSQQILQLPLDSELARLAKEKLARSLQPIDDVATRWLFRVNQTQQAELDERDRLPELALLFDRNLVIHYQNGESWYGIHPLITAYVLERMKVLDERETQQQG
ncbi:MAG TPA: hypothetical protein PLE99_04990 [Candidatus Thiothrix moscowensis]|uniref:hypothetical protein n=1 Tax=unclassified Thiothrix TaxID=2636184 RepID=UPI0025ED344D|nr:MULTISPECIES: hypothetical protein [unclassified Thiothrix]HRJ52103.1 hypothetical protein [Candidatus Thiothrix moscowensis]HRJ92386.1 hypothetical protein [Candidatus Thiothrix moscowensis]